MWPMWVCFKRSPLLTRHLQRTKSPTLRLLRALSLKLSWMSVSATVPTCAAGRCTLTPDPAHQLITLSTICKAAVFISFVDENASSTFLALMAYHCNCHLLRIARSKAAQAIDERLRTAPDTDVICALTMSPSAGAEVSLAAASGSLVVKSRKCLFSSTWQTYTHTSAL